MAHCQLCQQPSEHVAGGSARLPMESPALSSGALEQAQITVRTAVMALEQKYRAKQF